jgi:hypothetical protein
VQCLDPGIEGEEKVKHINAPLTFSSYKNKRRRKMMIFVGYYHLVDYLSVLRNIPRDNTCPKVVDIFGK